MNCKNSFICYIALAFASFGHIKACLRQEGVAVTEYDYCIDFCGKKLQQARLTHDLPRKESFIHMLKWIRCRIEEKCVDTLETHEQIENRKAVIDELLRKPTPIVRPTPIRVPSPAASPAASCPPSHHPSTSQTAISRQAHAAIVQIMEILLHNANARSEARLESAATQVERLYQSLDVADPQKVAVAIMSSSVQDFIKKRIDYCTPPTKRSHVGALP